MASLFSQNIGLNYKGILNLNTLNGNLTTTLQAITDGDGNASLLKLSTTELRIDSGVTNRRLTFGSNGQMSFVNDNDFIIDYSTGSANIFRLAYSGTDVKFNSDGYQFANYAAGTVYANLQSAGFAIGQGTTSASARLHVRGDGTNDIILLQNGAGTATRFKVDNDGNCTGIDGFFASYASFASGSNGVKVGGGLRIKNPNDGEMLLQNDSANDFSKIHFGTTSKPAVCQGAGTPEGAVAAPVGSIFMRSDGGAGTSFYVKESGTGNTGWVAK